jgi:CheY-like chemotaxis protein
MSILIVDDSPDEVHLLSSLLEKAGYRSLLTANSAEEAFRTLGIDGSESSPAAVDLVLMDLVMPQTDGLEACRRIRAHPQLHDLPIIVITVKSDPADLCDAFTAGVTDFIRKPVNEVELVARVSAALTLREERECRKEREQQLIGRTEELERALQEAKVLRGLIPVCNRYEAAGDWAGTRKARRVTIHCRLLFSAENLSWAEARVLDLSTSGCKAESLTPVSKGMELTVKLFLPDHKWELKLERAVVRWIEGKTFGLEFLSLRPAQRERIRLLLARSEQ